MITIDGKKMGKSLGNFINLNEFFSGKHKKLHQAYSPMTIRFFILQAHYRSTVDFSNDALKAAEKGFAKLMNANKTLDKLTISESSTIDVDKLESDCYSAMNDDFNTPILIAHLFEGVRIINLLKDQKEHITIKDLTKLKHLFNNFVVNILGLIDDSENNNGDLTNDLIALILTLRNRVKKNKDYNTSDQIRDKLEELNIQIKDEREGTTWKFKK